MKNNRDLIQLHKDEKRNEDIASCIVNFMRIFLFYFGVVSIMFCGILLFTSSILVLFFLPDSIVNAFVFMFLFVGSLSLFEKLISFLYNKGVN